MMDRMATLGIVVRSQGVRQADASLGSLATSAARTQRNVDALRGAFVAMAPVVAGGFGLSGLMRTFADFERGLINVGKTTDIQGEALRELGETIQDLATKEVPVPTQELVEIAEAAGQLGIKGVDAIEAFTETVSKLGLATDLHGDQAAKTMARMLNITGEATTDVDRLGSVFVRLGNNVAATEGEIARAANRLAGLVSTYKVASRDMAGMGATIRELGIPFERGTTALASAFRVMDEVIEEGGKKMGLLSSVMGKSAVDIATAFREDSVPAVMDFLEALKEAGTEAPRIFRDLGGGKGVQASFLLTLADRVERLRGNLEMANDEWEKNLALDREAGRAEKSFSAQMQLVANTMDRAAVAAGDELRPAIEGLVDDFADWVNEGRRTGEIAEFARDLADAMNALAVPLKLVTENFGELLTVATAYAAVRLGRFSSAATAGFRKQAAAVTREASAIRAGNDAYSQKARALRDYYGAKSGVLAQQRRAVDLQVQDSRANVKALRLTEQRARAERDRAAEHRRQMANQHQTLKNRSRVQASMKELGARERALAQHRQATAAATARLNAAETRLAAINKRLGTSQRRAIMGTTALSGSFRAARVAARGMGRALGSLSTFLGGPWGIAFTAATVAVGYLVTREDEATRVTRQLEDANRGLSDTFRDHKGDVDALSESYRKLNENRQKELQATLEKDLESQQKAIQSATTAIRNALELYNTAVTNDDPLGTGFASGPALGHRGDIAEAEAEKLQSVFDELEKKMQGGVIGVDAFFDGIKEAASDTSPILERFVNDQLKVVRGMSEEGASGEMMIEQLRESVGNARELAAQLGAVGSAANEQRESIAGMSEEAGKALLELTKSVDTLSGSFETIQDAIKETGEELSDTLADARGELRDTLQESIAAVGQLDAVEADALQRRLERSDRLAEVEQRSIGRDYDSETRRLRNSTRAFVRAQDDRLKAVRDVTERSMRLNRTFYDSVIGMADRAGVNTVDLERDILQQRRTIWGRSVNEHRAVIDRLVQQEEQRRERVEEIEERIANARQRQADFENEIRSSGMSDEEKGLLALQEYAKLQDQIANAKKGDQWEKVAELSEKAEESVRSAHDKLGELGERELKQIVRQYDFGTELEEGAKELKEVMRRVSITDDGMANAWIKTFRQASERGVEALNKMKEAQENAIGSLRDRATEARNTVDELRSKIAEVSKTLRDLGAQAIEIDTTEAIRDLSEVKSVMEDIRKLGVARSAVKQAQANAERIGAEGFESGFSLIDMDDIGKQIKRAMDTITNIAEGHEIDLDVNLDKARLAVAQFREGVGGIEIAPEINQEARARAENEINELTKPATKYIDVKYRYPEGYSRGGGSDSSLGPLPSWAME